MSSANRRLHMGLPPMEMDVCWSWSVFHSQWSSLLLFTVVTDTGVHLFTEKVKFHLLFTVPVVCLDRSGQGGLEGVYVVFTWGS